jgi:branched-chain amino acid transport system substrate-binding protein
MFKRVVVLLTVFLLLVALSPGKALTKDTLRIGTLFPFSGVIALYGNWCFNGVQIATEMINEKGGLWGKKIELVKGDAVDPKAAVTEVTRLITYEKLPLIIGTFSSPRAVPASEVANRYKRVYWEVAAEAERVTGRNLDYLFRPFCRSSDKAKPPVDYILKMVAPALKKDPKAVRIGLAFEQGDWGTDTGNAFMERAKEEGLKIVIALSHDTASLDFSSDIMRYKAARVDYLFMPTYLETLGVFWRQAKELGWHAPGGSTGSGTVDGLHKIIKTRDVDYHTDCEGPSMINPDYLDPKPRAKLFEFKKRWKAKYKEDPPYVGYLGFGHAWILYTDVLRRAGSLDPEAVRKAAMATDIPERGTTLAYGIKFFPPGHPQQGQNMRSYGVLTQYQNRKNVTIWPPKVQVAKPWIPTPSWDKRK